MLFTGTYPRSLDEKQRLALPKRLRDTLGQSPEIPLYLAPGTDGSLALYTEEAFSRLGEQLAQGSPAGQETRTFSRLFYSQALPVEVDTQGRIRIPQELATFAGLSREVMLLGVRDHLEIWDKGRWEQYLNHQQPRYDQLAESAFEAGVGATPRKTPAPPSPTQTPGRTTAPEEEHARPTQPR